MKDDDDDIQEYKKPWVGLTDDDHKDFANRTKLLPILAKTLAEYLFDDEGIDLILWNGVISSPLSSKDQFTILLGPTHEFGTRESVVHQHITFLDTLLGFERDQTDIAGTGTHQITDSLFTHFRFSKS